MKAEVLLQEDLNVIQRNNKPITSGAVDIHLRLPFAVNSQRFSQIICQCNVDRCGLAQSTTHHCRPHKYFIQYQGCWSTAAAAAAAGWRTTRLLLLEKFGPHFGICWIFHSLVLFTTSYFIRSGLTSLVLLYYLGYGFRGCFCFPELFGLLS